MKRVGKSDGFTLIELLIVIIVLGILVVIAIPMYLGQRDKARDSAVKEGIHHLQIGLGSYGVDHLDLYPATGADLRTTLVDASGNSYVDFWPKDPWSGGPMAEGTTPGAYTYTQLDGGAAFSLAGHLSGGRAFAVP